MTFAVHNARITLHQVYAVPGQASADSRVAVATIMSVVVKSQRDEMENRNGRQKVHGLINRTAEDRIAGGLGGFKER